MSYVINKDVFNKNVNKVLVYNTSINKCNGMTIKIINFADIKIIEYMKEGDEYILKLLNDKKEIMNTLYYSSEQDAKKEYNKLLNIIISDKVD